MDLSPLDIHENLVKLGEDWCDKNHAAELLEETRKVLLAQLMAESNEKTQNAKETWALRHKDYEQHLEAMLRARKLANAAKVKHESYKIYAEMLRTQSANERAANRYAT